MRTLQSLVAVGLIVGITTKHATADEPGPQLVEVTVGNDVGDFRGDDGRVLQAAVDYVARLGGGTIRVGPGRFLMRNSLILSDNIQILGTPGRTVLVNCDAHQSKLSSSGGTNERQVTVDEPDGFRIGDGVMVQDDKSMYGFTVTQATITARLDKHTFQISVPLVRDYFATRNARVTSGFPVVAARNAKNIAIEGLTIDGNSDNMQYLTGCRGGGIYLFECENVTVRSCHVHNYNGDGISFQTTQHVTIRDCICEGNTGVGLHPGCGTEHAVVRGTRCTNNKGDGLFLCWRVKHCIFEGNDLSDNQRHGISIGMKDSDNEFRDNTVSSNSLTGVFFRKQPAANGAHRNVFEANRILDNGVSVKIEGEHHELVFRENRIGYTTAPAEKQVAIQAGDGAAKLEADNNEFINVNPK
jgi:parallel beta-helix repeat protein